MDNNDIVKELVRLQILCIRWVERKTTLKCLTQRDMDRVLTSNKLTCTYGLAIANLKSNIFKYCDNSTYLKESVIKLEEIINNHPIKDIRFGLEPQKKFTKEEVQLDIYKLQQTLSLTTGMISIKNAAEIIGVPESTIKQACQQERLMNTIKISKTWIVNLNECKTYWNISDKLDHSEIVF